jgi:hypothetical protein
LHDLEQFRDEFFAFLESREDENFLELVEDQGNGLEIPFINILQNFKRVFRLPPGILSEVGFQVIDRVFAASHRDDQDVFGGYPGNQPAVNDRGFARSRFPVNKQYFAPVKFAVDLVQFLLTSEEYFTVIFGVSIQEFERVFQRGLVIHINNWFHGFIPKKI